MLMYRHAFYHLLYYVHFVCDMVYMHNYGLLIGLKKSEGRQETNHNCVCMHGYLQPQPFIERNIPTTDGV